MNDTTLSNIKNTQDIFYSISKKKTFLKENQKIQCAEAVLKQFSIHHLIAKTIHVCENSNKIFISYAIYKTYAIANNYQLIIDTLIQIITQTIQKFGKFEIHIDLDLFTSTAMQRNLNVFQLYYDTCCKVGLYYNEKTLDKIIIYNTPSVIQSLSTLLTKFTDKSIKEKITLLYKEKK